MKVLSLQLEKSSGCALMIDGAIVFSSSEERFSRIKSDSLFPKKAIKAALDFAKIKAKDLDKVLICSTEVTLYASLVNLYSFLSVKDQLRMMKEYWEPKLIDKKKVSFLYFLKDKIQLNKYPFNTKYAKVFPFLKKNFKHKIDQNDQKKPFQSSKDAKIVSNFFINIISSYLKIDKNIIEHVDHHTCHAAYAFFASPIRHKDSTIFTADAFGDYLSGTVSKYDKKNNKLKRVKSYSHTDFQLARIYRFVTIYLRMLGDSHEYKVMGLAPYYDGSRYKEVENVFHKMQKVKGTKIIFNKKIKNIFYYLEKELFNYRFDYIATALQSFSEKILVKWFENILKKYGGTHITFSGGQSMNVKANYQISKIKKIKKIFVCGSGTDDTLPIGACYDYASKNNEKTIPLKDMYLGTDANYSKNDLKKFSKYKITKVTNMNQVLNCLTKHQIIAVCRNRAEMGQRSLGNRSILADPRFSQNIQKINNAIKQRDFWMPFAPVILSEYQKKLIKNPKNIESPFMTFAFETTNFAHKNLIAAIHQADKTARAQILTKSHNKDLWELINLFYKKTGVPGLLNTSFNLHGFPIVNNIFDAKKVLEKSELSALWLNNHLIEKLE
jgi:carbamoyltransferase|tara:strand:+ start:54 stop:1883 length:1830 start_codon:yes stop_codon:yes gene_type:complete